MRRVRVAIVGGGISGLSLLHALRTQHGFAATEVTLLEASGQCGGNLRGIVRDGFRIDEGPDSWVAQKPEATQLARALGLGDRLIGTIYRKVYVLTQHGKSSAKLQPLPDGLQLGIPTKMLPLITTPLLSWKGKARAALDMILPTGFGRGAGLDESVGALVERRLGREVLEVLAGPLLGGLFTGSAHDLSVTASFPQLQRFEDNGGLILGARKARTAREQSTRHTNGLPASTFDSLRGGVTELVDALTARFTEEIQLHSLVTRITRPDPLRSSPPGELSTQQVTPAGWLVERLGGEVLYADHVVIAGPAHVAAKLIDRVDESLSQQLDDIPYGSSATVFLAIEQAKLGRQLDATGYLVPPSLHRDVSASTWISAKWQDRAPPGMALVRFFFGASLAERDEADLVQLAIREAREILGLRGEPLFSHVGRFLRASPQPKVGHLGKVGAIERALPNGLSLLGSAYHGVGISDCVRQAQELASRITHSHVPPSVDP